MKFETKIRKARFVVSPFSAEQMQQIGQVAADSIIARIKRGENVQDASSKALKPGRNGKKGYPEMKVARGRAPIRDWYFRGLTLGSLKVKSADENRVTIGFVNPQADTIAHVNNLREKAFGESPSDRRAVNAAVTASLKQYRVVRFAKSA